MVLKRASFLSSRILKKDALWVGIGRACRRPIRRISHLKSRDVDFAQVHRNCAQILPTGVPLDHVLVVAARIRAGPITSPARQVTQPAFWRLQAIGQWSRARNIRIRGIFRGQGCAQSCFCRSLDSHSCLRRSPISLPRLLCRFGGLCDGSTMRGAVLRLILIAPALRGRGASRTSLLLLVSLPLSLGCEAKRRQSSPRPDVPPTEAIPLPPDAINVG
jgi:hypothetical protein